MGVWWERERRSDLGLQEWPVQGTEYRREAQRGQGLDDLAALGRYTLPRLGGRSGQVQSLGTSLKRLPGAQPPGSKAKLSKASRTGADWSPASGNGVEGTVGTWAS